MNRIGSSPARAIRSRNSATELLSAGKEKEGPDSSLPPACAQAQPEHTRIMPFR